MAIMASLLRQFGRTLALCGMLQMLVFIPSPALSGEVSLQGGGVVSLEGILKEALERNPKVLAAKAEWAATRKRIPQSSALPDPTAGYMVMGEDLQTRVGPQENVFELEQMIPFPGKLWQRHRAAVSDAAAAQARFEETEQQIILDISFAYYDLYAADATLKVVNEIKDVLEKFEGIAQARYASGSGLQRDVAKAQAEVSNTLERLFVLRQKRESLEARLNALLDREPQSVVGPVMTPSVPSLSLSLEELSALAARHRPEVKESIAMLEQSGHRKTLAKFEYLPDLSVGFRYVEIGGGTTTQANDGEDAWMIPLKITLPLWQNRLLSGVQEAEQQVDASQARVTDIQNLVEYEVRDAYYRLQAARQVVGLYENALIPQAELAFRSDQAGYEAGRTDILNLIDSERVYLNAKVAHHQAVAEAMKSLAALERAVGMDLVSQGDSP